VELIESAVSINSKIYSIINLAHCTDLVCDAFFIMGNINHKLKYERTLNGVVSSLYRSHVRRSKLRGVNPPEYSMTELREWLSVRPRFKTLYNKWVKSGFDKKIKPSLYRKDKSKVYSLDNIIISTSVERKVSNERKKYKKVRKKSRYKYSIGGFDDWVF
jgi:hypothetical protein